MGLFYQCEQVRRYIRGGKYLVPQIQHKEVNFRSKIFEFVRLVCLTEI